ncbi:hypothetical protein AAG906_016752 [Vitis piasezkii]
MFSMCFSDKDFDYGLLMDSEMDGDDSITDVAIPSFISTERASNLVDPPLSFDFMFGKLTPIFGSVESVGFKTSISPRSLRLALPYLLTRKAN